MNQALHIILSDAVSVKMCCKSFRLAMNVPVRMLGSGKHRLMNKPDANQEFRRGNPVDSEYEFGQECSEDPLEE